VWEIYYEPLTTDVDTPGDYLGLFRILFAGGKPGYYPGEEEYIVIEVVPA
jgi:hypothetical protein